ncbi:MAG: lytic transglycosylase domain-containing protein [Polaromonas sp.]
MDSHAKFLKALGLPLLALVLAASQATPARADMWRFVDAQGVSHFSGTQLDKRYQLLFRGAESFSAGAGKATGGSETVRASAVPAASPRRLTYFDVSPSYMAVKHLLREASETHGIDYELLQAVIATESGFNTQAVSPKGAVGLMQLIPPTAERYGVKAEKDLPIQKKLTDPRTNIGAGSRYLRDLIKLFPGQLELAVAAYNAGEGAVQRAGNKIPNYPETQNYVKNVMQLYNRLKLPVIGGMSGGVASSGRVRMELMGGNPSGLAPGVSLE